jgi:hypothetical protein
LAGRPSVVVVFSPIWSLSANCYLNLLTCFALSVSHRNTVNFFSGSERLHHKKPRSRENREAKSSEQNPTLSQKEAILAENKLDDDFAAQIHELING